MSKSKTAVCVKRSGQRILVMPPVEELIGYIYSVAHSYSPQSPHAFKVVRKPSLLLDIGKTISGECVFGYAGMDVIVQELLHELGYSVVLEGRRPGNLEPADHVHLADKHLRPFDKELLDLVAMSDRGLVQYHPGHVAPAQLIAQIALAWPRLTILVTATRIEDVRRLRESLEALTGETVNQRTHKDGAAGRTRIVVATYSCVAEGDVEIEFRQIYIAVNAAELFHGNGYGVQGINLLHRARVYGFIPWGQYPPNRLDRLNLLSLFGTQEATIPRPAHVLRPIVLLRTRIEGGPKIGNGSVLDLKRSGIWHHPVRQRRLVRLVRLLQRGDKAALASQFPVGANWIAQLALERIAILVEGIEHALSWLRLLPNLGLSAGPCLSVAGLSLEDQRLVERAQRISADAEVPVVCTYDGIQRLQKINVLVRADGGCGFPPLGAVHGIVHQDNASLLLVVDCDDRHHPLLRRWSKQRCDAYVLEGWAFAGEPTPTPLEEFFAISPRPRDFNFR